jgi:peptidoglycan/xylan/chitin deacetylase (PgdA/CDA1 family)
MNVVKRGLRRLGLRRTGIATARVLGERQLLALSHRGAASRRARILCYHSVGTPGWGVNDVSPARFRYQVESALEAGFQFVSAAAIASGGGEDGQLAITFDDGLRSVALNAAPVLAEYAIPWSLFVVTDWADGRHPFGEDLLLGWNDIVRVAESGATIGSHSVTHPDFRRLDESAIEHELQVSRRTIEARTGLNPTSFAIPFGQHNNWPASANRAARQAGYRHVYAQSEARRPAGTIPRTFVTRFDDSRLFRAALQGAFDSWEEWF